MRRFFLTGGSGFVGSRLLHALVQRGDSVAALDRSGRIRHAGGLSQPSQVISGDLLAPETYRNSLAGVNAVVHLAAATGRASPDEHWRSNALGTEALVQECRAARVQRFLFVSSIAVTFRDLSGYPYARAKVRAEESVRASGIAYTIVRPTMVLGPGSPVLAGLSRLALLPIIPVFGNGRSPVQPVFVDDLVDAILAILDEDRFANETFEMGGKVVVAIEELLQAIRVGHTGRRARVCRIPIGATLSVVRAAESVGLGRLLPFTAGQLATFRFAGTAADNDLIPNQQSKAGLDAMLSAPPSAIVSSEALAEECRAFTRYLVATRPTSYVVEQYIKAHSVSRKFLPTDTFDLRLVGSAVRHPLLARLVDSYARVFRPSSLLRRKLVLLLAILETAPPTCHLIDVPPHGSRTALAGQLAVRSVLWLMGLVVATAFLFPARLLLGGRKIR